MLSNKLRALSEHCFNNDKKTSAAQLRTLEMFGICGFNYRDEHRNIANTLRANNIAFHSNNYLIWLYDFNPNISVLLLSLSQ